MPFIKGGVVGEAHAALCPFLTCLWVDAFISSGYFFFSSYLYFIRYSKRKKSLCLLYGNLVLIFNGGFRLDLVVTKCQRERGRGGLEENNQRMYLC